jgi:NAD-dependent dihydropyrimidine dehydrogenase PreA subunit
MENQGIYERLAEHLSRLPMGYPVTPDLVEILKLNFSVEEARVALAFPTDVTPLQTISVNELAQRLDLPVSNVKSVLDGLVEKNLLFTRKTHEGGLTYGLLQVGFGFPQVFFWKGNEDPHTREMASLVPKYFNRKVTKEAYSKETKPYRYIPVGKAIEPDLQAVLPFHLMESVISRARLFAVCHCSCRVIAALRGRPCPHPIEVCLKFDDMAEFVIERGMGREINMEEAWALVKSSEEAGLVHFVDNAEGQVKHNCNCCGCACWNVGAFKRRKIPRDILMATYFIRATDHSSCVGCGECVEICPVDAVKVEGDFPVVDEQWCIGCGLCALKCPNDAIRMKRREEGPHGPPAVSFRQLHQMILKERLED